MVWIFAPFSSILTYEFAKALTHHPRGIKVALFGSDAKRARQPVSGPLSQADRSSCGITDLVDVVAGAKDRPTPSSAAVFSSIT